MELEVNEIDFLYDQCDEQKIIDHRISSKTRFYNPLKGKEFLIKILKTF